MRISRAVTIGAVAVTVWVFKLVFLAVVLTARPTLAQFDDFHVLDGRVVTVLATVLAAGAAALARLIRSILLALTARRVAFASLNSLNVFHGSLLASALSLSYCFFETHAQSPFTVRYLDQGPR